VWATVSAVTGLLRAWEATRNRPLRSWVSVAALRTGGGHSSHPSWASVICSYVLRTGGGFPVTLAPTAGPLRLVRIAWSSARCVSAEVTR
jgi:hypothetical protein